MYRLALVLAGGLILTGCPNEKPTDDSDEPVDDSTVQEVDLDGDGFNSEEDCDDNDNGSYPGAVETCDGSDNNCDGAVDEAGATGESTFYMDGDSDTHGDAAMTATGCTAPTGYVTSSDDCNDADGDVYPGADENCDGADNDCDTLVDDADDDVADGGTYYPDADGDTFGDSAPGSGVTACVQPAGYVTEPVDCDDSDATSYPGGTEVCDGADNDCDGTPDDGLLVETGYPDADGDSYGDDALMYVGCDVPADYVNAGGDCDDSDAAVNMGATEVCDALDTDEDCDGLADDDDLPADAGWWYPDTDGDGYGDTDGSLQSCDQPGGTVNNPFDPFEDAVLADFAEDGDLSDCTDVVAGAGAVYAICFDSNGDAAVVSVDPRGTFTVLYSGEPLVYPVGITISQDQRTLYLADVAYDGGIYSGGIIEVPVAGGSATEIGVAGLLDLPADITWGDSATTALVTGLDVRGDAALFEVDVTTGSVFTLYSGSPMMDPLSLSRDILNGEIYVMDSMAGDGRASILRFDGNGRYQSELATGFRVDMNSGLVVDSSGIGAVYGTVRSAGITHAMTDGSGMSEALDSSLIDLPGGIAKSNNEVLYITELGSGTSDIYTLTY